jgi:hypothetical protein
MHNLRKKRDGSSRADANAKEDENLNPAEDNSDAHTDADADASPPASGNNKPAATGTADVNIDVDVDLAEHSTSQVSCSQQEEDERLGFLDKSGALDQVMGSQSLLSQEIQDLSQTHPQLHQPHQLYAPTFEESSSPAKIAIAARSLGLLTQEEAPSQSDYHHQASVTNSQLSFLFDAAQALEDQDTANIQHDYQHTNDPLQQHQQQEFIMESSFDDDEHPPSPARRSTRRTAGPKRVAPTYDTFSRPKSKLSPQKKRKMDREQETKKSQTMAQQAAGLAAQVIDSPQVAKQLLLTMALVRINPRSAPTSWPHRGSSIPEGFFWGTYPPLETVLRQHMREYYDLSTKMCQSKDQQHFNNVLVVKIRGEAAKYGWIFGPRFTDKILRDRIRCFFKTHIQNSKKRLRTMVKNPTKKANAKALVKHLDLIQTYSEMEPGDEPIDNFLGEMDDNKLPAPRKNEMNLQVDQEAVHSVMALGMLSNSIVANSVGV